MEKISSLDLLESSDVDGLNVVFETFNLLNEIVRRNFLVFYNTGDPEFHDTITDGFELGRSPNKTVHFDSTAHGFYFFQVGFVIPWLDVEGDGGFSDGLTFDGFFGLFFGVVGGHSLCFYAFGFSVVF